MHSKRYAPLCALMLSALPAASALAANYDLVPWWEAYRASDTDSVYTVDFSAHNAALTNGYVEHGVAAWFPCAPGGQSGPHGEAPMSGAGDPHFGYYPTATNIPMNFACARPAGTLPLYRYYKGGVTSDHFYTTSLADTDIVYGQGFTFERVEGYLFSTQVAGTLPLYRLSRCVVVNNACDLEHRYTLGANARQSLADAGWGVDRIEGYAFPRYDNDSALVTAVGSVNNLSVNGSVTVPLKNVPPSPLPGMNVPINGSGRARVQGMMEVNVTSKPANATQQRMYFQFYTGNLFTTGTPLNHLPFFVHGDAGLGKDGLFGIPYHGLGIYFVSAAKDGLCAPQTGTGGQVVVELFGNLAPGKLVDCAANLSGKPDPDHLWQTRGITAPLEANRKYAVEVTVSDDATLTMKIVDIERNLSSVFKRNYASWFTCPLTSDSVPLPANMSYCGNPYPGSKFPKGGTGYFVLPVFDVVDPNTAMRMSAYYTNLHIQWLDAAGNVLSTL